MKAAKIECVDSTWSPVPGFPGYYVSRDGCVLSTAYKEPKVMKHIVKKTGYHYVYLYRNGHGIKKYVHDLVLSVFMGPAPVGLECRHFDGNPANNALDNLTWGTKKENSDDKIRHGTVPSGERSGTHKLSEEDVRKLRRLYAAGGESYYSLAIRFGVSHTAIRRAVIGKSWSCVGVNNE